jgi:hypothetical protein
VAAVVMPLSDDEPEELPLSDEDPPDDELDPLSDDDPSDDELDPLSDEDPPDDELDSPSDDELVSVVPPSLELDPVSVPVPGYGCAQIPRSATQNIPRGQLSPPEQSSTHTLVVSSRALLQRAGASPSPSGAGQQLQSMKQPRVHTANWSMSLKHCPPPPQSPGHWS